MSDLNGATTEQGPSCLPAPEEKAVSQATPATLSQQPTAETRPADSQAETPMSQQGPGNIKAEKEEQEITSPTPFGEDPPQFPASPPSADTAEHLSVAAVQKSPCQDPVSPPPLSLSTATQEVPSAVDMEGRLSPHSEEDDEEEDDEPLKGEDHDVDIKQEFQEREVKPELLLDEMSNMSHGDESSSGFMGSPGEPDPQLSMELGLVAAGHSHPDNLLTETDDSLPFEPLRSDREKVKRRGSPGRSRVKQVRSPRTSLLL